MYSPKIEQAIQAAAVLHHGQTRKGPAPVPYFAHLYSVALIAANYTDNEDVIVTALLHDTLEDTDYSEEELRTDFGDVVMQMVRAVTEPSRDTHSWQERKTMYASTLKTAPEGALIVAAADKIHNMRSIVEGYANNHTSFLKHFAGSLKDRALAYQDISNILNSRLDNPIVGEFNQVYSAYKQFLIDVEKST